ncbi:MAG: DUF126 domain-containing protein [Bacillota bacterium]
MTEIYTFRCHKISGGVAEGEALKSSDDICFYLIDPKSGTVIEEGHAAAGKKVGGKVLIFPSGKGSSVVQADGLYQLSVHGNAPKAMIIKFPDPVLVASCIIMNILLVDRVDEKFYALVEDGDVIRVDADQGIVLLSKKGG